MIDYWDRSQSRHPETVHVLENVIGLDHVIITSVLKSLVLSFEKHALATEARNTREKRKTRVRHFQGMPLRTASLQLIPCSSVPPWPVHVLSPRESMSLLGRASFASRTCGTGSPWYSVGSSPPDSRSRIAHLLRVSPMITISCKQDVTEVSAGNYPLMTVKPSPFGNLPRK